MISTIYKISDYGFTFLIGHLNNKSVGSTLIKAVSHVKYLFPPKNATLVIVGLNRRLLTSERDFPRILNEYPVGESAFVNPKELTGRSTISKIKARIFSWRIIIKFFRFIEKPFKTLIKLFQTFLLCCLSDVLQTS